MNNKENKNLIKNKILKVAALLGLFLLVFGVSYALFKVTLEGTKRNKISTGVLDVKIENESENGINLENAVPISSLEGLETVPYTFDIVNYGTIPADYKIYLEVPNASTLPDNKIKYNLKRTDVLQTVSFDFDGAVTLGTEEGKDELSYDNISEVFNTISCRLLSNVVKTNEENNSLYLLDVQTIGPNQTYSYEFRNWVAYAAGTEVNNKNFEGKIKLVATQGTKDSAYLVDYIDITGDIYNNTDVRMYETKYSDGSVRYEGIGLLQDSYTNTEFVGFLFSDFVSKLKNILDANSEVKNMEGYKDFSSSNELIRWVSANIENLPSDVQTQINNIEEDSDFNGNLYFGDGISGFDPIIPNGDWNPFSSLPLKKIYLSESTTIIGSGSFRNIDTLEEVSYTKLRDPNIKKLGLDINRSAFYGNPNLLKVTLPDSLKSLGESSFSGCTNAEITIEALQSNVTLSSDSFQDVKSVTWLNG